MIAKLNPCHNPLIRYRAFFLGDILGLLIPANKLSEHGSINSELPRPGYDGIFFGSSCRERNSAKSDSITYRQYHVR